MNSGTGKADISPRRARLGKRTKNDGGTAGGSASGPWSGILGVDVRKPGSRGLATAAGNRERKVEDRQQEDSRELQGVEAYGASAGRMTT